MNQEKRHKSHFLALRRLKGCLQNGIWVKKNNNSKVGGSITRGVGIRPLSCRTPHESQTTQQRHKRAYLNSPKVTPRHAEVWHKSDEERHDLTQGKTRLNSVCLTLKTIVVKTKKTFYLFCIFHASWLAQKSHATVSANQTKSIVTFSDAFRLRLQEFVNGSDYFIWWSDLFTIGRPIYLVSGCKTTCSNHSNNVPKPFLAINGSGKVCGKGRKLGVQNRDFSHFSNSSFHIENEICGSVTSSRGENTQPPFLNDNSGGISVTHRYKKPGNFFSVLQKLLPKKTSQD